MPISDEAEPLRMHSRWEPSPFQRRTSIPVNWERRPSSEGSQREPFAEVNQKNGALQSDHPKWCLGQFLTSDSCHGERRLFIIVY